MMLNNQLIKKVNVVCMTHFDMGFTDIAENIMHRYVHEFIPAAIELAGELNSDSEKQFVWTLGAYLITYYLREAEEEAKELLVEAIKRGDISYHGLAFTAHTELMDRDLLDFDISFAEELDRFFGHKTIAAKLSDVPGHTRAIIKSMAEHGMKYLHIGVNASSMNPEVPKTFLWRSGKHEILVQYSDDYGSTCYADGMEEVLEFVFLGDNLGIPTKEEVLNRFEALRNTYPNAAVKAASLEDYARLVCKYKKALPVITEEIGDTWIHGIASDPVRTMKLKRLLALKDQWKRDGRFETGKPEYHGFMEHLLLVCEHTWALDYKKYLFDFENWTKADFQKAREENRVNDILFTRRNTALMKAIQKEKKTDHLESSYRFYESSYKEQHEYLVKAIEALPPLQQKEALDVFVQLKEQSELIFDNGRILYPGELTEVNGWRVCFDGSGAICYLEKDKRKWIQDGCFGRFSYETYHALDCVSEYHQYNRAFKENMIWSEADFSKPGLETVEDLEHRNYPFHVRGMKLDQCAVEIELAGNQRAVEDYGCPGKAMIRYTFGEEIGCELAWKQKAANKMPEALWFDWKLDVENPYRWHMIIMDEEVSPLDVVLGGNRRQHCVEQMLYDGADGRVKIRNLDSPLISVGGRRLYGGCRELPDVRDGFSYCLFNNKWGTNFPMWCEDDCYFQYIISIENK